MRLPSSWKQACAGKQPSDSVAVAWGEGGDRTHARTHWPRQPNHQRQLPNADISMQIRMAAVGALLAPVAGGYEARPEVGMRADARGAPRLKDPPRRPSHGCRLPKLRQRCPN